MVQRAQLSNGLSIVLLERHSTSLVNITLAVDAGYASDSKERAGLASLALELLDDGTTTRDTFRIVDDLDALGAQVFTDSSLDLSLVRLRALAPKLRPTLEVFADVVLRPSFAPDMIEIARRNRLARIGQEKAQPMAITQRVVPELLFGPEHAYGKPLTGSGFETSINAITREELRAWYRSWFHPNNATLIVAGNVTLAALVPELERVFGGWQRGQAPVKQVTATGAASGRRVYLIDKPVRRTRPVPVVGERAGADRQDP